MTRLAFVTLLTTIFSIAVKVIGMPDQIRTNHHRKSTGGLSSWFMLSTFISYVLWVIHGLQVHDMALIIGQGLGVVVTAIVLWQMFLYRNGEKVKLPPLGIPLLWYSVIGLLTRGRPANSNYTKKSRAEKLGEFDPSLVE
jgi:uncharacterized protein with PQ loop repeat